MEIIFNSVTEATVQILVVIIGALASLALNKVKNYFETLKKKDEMGMINLITDIAVEYAEKELTGAAGKEKRDFAIDKAISILADKGIKVSRDEVIAGIENGVNKLKNK
ncbi:phage holin, LLH family [uncultured Metabacillus sp.]|uniref:phage holin, LLH family n=1 Tax=uncultured Metabacillus sp. TaxID=2860135 RepID=UPI00262C3CEA|nr:phage holin, LLH family [uncultured Metabacillus sp.]